MKHRRLAGCLPIKGDLDQCQGCPVCDPLVLLITARSNPNRLVFPKGGVKKSETPEEAAQRESWEEAGIRGVILGRIDYRDSEYMDRYLDDELFCYDPDTSGGEEEAADSRAVHRNSPLATEHCRWFVLRVDREEEDYPERGQRTKHWMKLSVARRLSNIRENTRRLLEKLHDLLKRTRPERQEGETCAKHGGSGGDNDRGRPGMGKEGAK